MKFNYIGILLIISGFATLFVPFNTYPVLLHTILPYLFFWSGFFLLFYPLKKNEKINGYLKGARSGIYLNFIVTIISIAWWYIFFYFDFGGYIGGQLIRIFGAVANPIRSVFDLLIPIPMTKQPDGSFLFMYGFTRSLLTDFFNLIFYALVGICLRLIKERKDHVAPESTGGC